MSKQVVLMYHDIYLRDNSESGFQNSTALKYKVSATAFEEQVKAIDSYLSKNKLPASAVEFTFDDGGVSFMKVVAPILERYGFKGVFFISTGYIGSNGFLDVNQIRELVRRGHKIGSHSHTHPERMSSLTVQEINDEWSLSQTMLQEVIGTRPNVASIPNGYSSREVLNAMVSAGITEIHTSYPTTTISHYKGMTIKGRYVITDTDSVATVIAIVSSPFMRFKKTARQRILNIAKAILGNVYLVIRNKLSKE